MPVANERYWTVEDVWALPGEPGVRYEAVDGALLVTPAPSLLHQRAVLDVARQLDVLARSAGVGEAIIAPTDVVVPPSQILQPDVYVMRPLAKAELRASPRELPLPLLVVEVLSPSSARIDRVTKRRLYQRVGIEYWVVDLDARVIERWMPTATCPEIAVETLSWRPAGATSPLVLDVAALMARVHGDG